jgi:hypothetical protein
VPQKPNFRPVTMAYVFLPPLRFFGRKTPLRFFELKYPLRFFEPEKLFFGSCENKC